MTEISDAEETETLASGEPSSGESFSGDAMWEPGTSLGRYVILDWLGAGGMGMVLAAYDPKLDRRVAVKMLHRGPSTEAARARLQREAQALAQLAHPNVVAVHDVGEHDGRAFVAMEYVEGRTLGAWRDAEPRSVEEILAVFIAAGRGLAAAHDRDLVHRDFKPDNVMLGDDGRVRVMDFGLARMAESEANHPGKEAAESVDVGEAEAESEGDTRLRLTRPGAVMGTPAYMAPEQHLGMDTDARSDQFSFCVALYEALWGSRPFVGTTLIELAIAVTTRDPEPPPRAAPSWLRAVVLRGLSREPQDRFPTMNALLDALAVDAVSRRRVGVAVLGGVAVVIGLAAARRGAKPAPKCVAGAERIAEVWNAGASERVRGAFAGDERPFIADTIRGVDEALTHYATALGEARNDACAATVVRGEQSQTLMDLRIGCLGREQAALSAVIDVLAEADAELRTRAVDLVESLPPVSACADVEALSAAVPPPTDPDDAAEVQQIREALERVKQLHMAERNEEALSEASPLSARALAVDYPPVLGEIDYERAVAIQALARYDEAEAIFGDVAMRAITHGQTELAAKASASQMFVLSLWLGKPDEALALEPLARALALAAGEGERPEAFFAQELGAVLYTKGDYAAARVEFERSLAIHEAISVTPDDVRLASVHNNLGLTLVRLGELDAAREHYDATFEIRERVHGPDHPLLADIHNNYGLLHYAEADYAAARQRFERALALEESTLGSDHPSIATRLMNIGVIVQTLGDIEGALPYYERALAILEAKLGKDNPGVVDLLSNMAVAHAGLGDYGEARRLMLRSLALLETKLGDDHPDVAIELLNLADWDLGEGKYDSAEAQYRRALVIREAKLGPDHTETVFARWAIARLELERGDTSAGIEGFEVARTAWLALHGPDHPQVARAELSLGSAKLEAGRPAEALEHFIAARDIHERGGGEHADQRYAWLGIGEARTALGEFEEAEVALERAMKAAGEPDSIAAAPVLFARAKLALKRGDRASALEHAEAARVAYGLLEFKVARVTTWLDESKLR